MLARRSIAAVLLSSASLVLTSLISPTFAADDWAAPEPMAPGASDVDIAVSRNGDAIMTWATDSGVFARFRAEGQDWGRVASVTDRRDWDLHAFMDHTGNATVITGSVLVADSSSEESSSWTLNDLGNPGNSGVASLSTAVGDGYGHQLVSSTWWAQDFGSGAELYRREGHRSWHPSQFPRRGLRQAFAIAPGDVAIAAGSTRDGVKVTTSTRNASWTKPRRVIATSGGEPVIAVNVDGDVVVAVAAADGLHAAYKRAGGRWGSEFKVHETRPVDNVAGVVSDEGRATIAYVTSGLQPTVSYAGTDRTGGWHRHGLLDSDLSAPHGLSLTANRHGDVLAAWASGEYNVPMASLHRLGHDWTEPTAIASPHPVSPEHPVQGAPEVIAEPNGMFTATFIQDGVVLVDLADDGEAPSARIVRPRRDQILRNNFRVRWTATDDMVGVRDYDVRVKSAPYNRKFSTWHQIWRDTTSTDARFNGEAGHTYCFSVRATDRLGKVGKWSRKRCVSTAVDDRAFRISAGWDEVESADAFENTLTTTTFRRQRLVLDHVRARDISIVVRSTKQSGKVIVRHAGRNLERIDLATEKLRNKHVIHVHHARQAQLGRLIIRVISDDKPVQIDGAIVSP